MDALTISAASGMKARMESLEMLANNLANQSAAGYKADREFYSLYLAPEAWEATGEEAASSPPVLPVIDRHWTDFSQGALLATGVGTHLAISGRGFFVVEAPQGRLYTRNGDFHLSPGGELVTAQGYRVLDEAGRPVRVDPSRPFEVSADGAVRQEGGLVATLAIADFPDLSVLAKQAGTYFRAVGLKGEPVRASGFLIYQGKLESSNVAPAEGAVRLISLMRQFEMLGRAVAVASEMSRKALEEVARVGS
jgi:flagellar basal-body rod protein FlgG